MAINGPALGTVAIGSIFIYAALKGKSVLQVTQSIILGQSPKTVKPTNQISTPNDSTNTIPGVQSSALPSPNSDYSHAQLVQLWTQMGGNPATANNAACHGIQESNGNPTITSSNPDGGINVGIWQLDTNGVGKGYSIEELQNAQNNARITIAATNNGTNWSEWSTPGC